MFYDPLDWFWTIAGDDSKAWSSASSAYVFEWPSNRTTRIATEAELSEVLRPYGLFGPDLAAYAADKRWRVETGGCFDPLDRPVATDRDSQTKLIAEMVAIGAGLRPDPSPWKFADGTFAVLSNAAMLDVIMAARTHIAEAFAIEAIVLAGLGATYNTVADVDGAAWPVNPS